MFDFDDIGETNDAQEEAEEAAPPVDPVEAARQAAERLRDSEWKVRWDACRALAALGAAAAPHAKILARVAAKDKDGDVRKAAAGVLSDLRASGAELPKDYLDDYADDDDGAARNAKKAAREAEWAERRRLREQAFEERRKALEEKERLEAERQKEEDRLIYGDLEAEEPTYTAAPVEPPWSAEVRQVPEAVPQPPPPPPPPPRPAQSSAGFAAQPQEEGDSEESEEEEEQQQTLSRPREPKKRPETSVTDIVCWEGPRANFSIFGDVLPMRLDREDMTPNEVTDIWEKSWGIAYASRIKFEAPPGSATKWLNPREDVVPTHPALVVLHEKGGSVLIALAAGMREYGSMNSEAAEAVRRRRLQQGLASVEKRQKASVRDRERTHLKETRARAKGNSHKDREDRRVLELRQMRQSALGISEPASQGPPQRLMRELRRPAGE